MNWRINATVLAFLLWQPAVAEEAPVYESLSGLSIGRIFYTQDERDFLDQRRHLAPQSQKMAVKGKRTAARSADEHNDAAGFISSSSGKARIWSKDRFVPVDRNPVEAVSFPGDVEVTRHDEADENAD